MTDPTLFQYCQKLVIFRHNDNEILLARRAGEADYDRTYTFIGGKLEITDGDFVAGILREKNEELGEAARLKVCPVYSYNVYFIKQSGQHMIVPHYYAEYISGEISLSDEYDDYKWIPVDELENFEPKIKNITEIVSRMVSIKAGAKIQDFINL